jgi:SNF2 family DNA or RNA helicase
VPCHGLDSGVITNADLPVSPLSHAADSIEDAKFAPGMIVRMRNNRACAGQITGQRVVKAGSAYWAVLLADGSGVRMLRESQLEAETTAPDPLEELRAGRFSDPSVFRRLLIHHQLTGRLRDVIYSMDVTDTDFHAYQFKPVIKVLASPSQGLLIADEVGLGKTIEAGLIWTELVARFDAHRLLVVCPKSLTEKWRQELWQKFSVDAKIVNASELLTYLERERDGSDGFALIASLSSLRPSGDWEDDDKSARAKLMRFLDGWEGDEYLVDCVVFDEAHHLRNADTVSHAFAQRVMEIADYKLLLSATPINLRSEDLRNLLRLLDKESFDNPHMFDVVAEENRPLVAAREAALNPKTTFKELAQIVETIPRGEVLKIDRQLDNLLGEIRAPGVQDSRRLRNRIAAQLEEMSLLGSIVNRTRRRDVNDLKVERRVHHHHWSMTQQERAFYDFLSDIVREHAWSLNASERFLLATPQRLIASSLAAACGHWGRKAHDLSLDDVDDETHPAGSLVVKLAEACEGGRLAKRLEADDTKYACLVKALNQHWKSDPDEKLILFSSFRVTLDYLARRLKADGITVELMHGGIKEPRNDVLARFQAAPNACVLLTSEVGGEGLDMQFCRSLINYDLPWNPMKVEQRIGRIDRIGQKAEAVTVVSLICADTIEEQIYDRLYRRLLTIEQTLGAFEAILGSEIQQLEQRLLDPKLTKEEAEREIERRAQAIEERQRQEQELENEAPGLIAHGDMILDRIEENHRPERQVRGEELADYVHETLSKRYPGSRIDDVPGEPGLFDIVLSAEAQHSFKDMLTRSNRARTKLSRERKIRATFDREASLPKSVERVTAVHPLVRFAAELRKQAAEGIALQPVVCVQVGTEIVQGIEPGTYVAAVEKWFVDGVVRVDRLAYVASSQMTRLDFLQAETLMQAALKSGRPVYGEASADIWAEAAATLLQTDLADTFDDFVEEEAARHEDRVATGLARIDRQRTTKARDLEWRISEWKRSGDPKKLRLIPAQQGKLDKLLAGLEFRRGKLLEDRDQFAFQRDLLGLAVVQVGVA